VAVPLSYTCSLFVSSGCRDWARLCQGGSPSLATCSSGIETSEPMPVCFEVIVRSVIARLLLSQQFFLWVPGYLVVSSILLRFDAGDVG